MKQNRVSIFSRQETAAASLHQILLVDSCGAGDVDQNCTACGRKRGTSKLVYGSTGEAGIPFTMQGKLEIKIITDNTTEVHLVLGPRDEAANYACCRNTSRCLPVPETAVSVLSVGKLQQSHQRHVRTLHDARSVRRSQPSHLAHITCSSE